MFFNGLEFYFISDILWTKLLDSATLYRQLEKQKAKGAPNNQPLSKRLAAVTVIRCCEGVDGGRVDEPACKAVFYIANFIRALTSKVQ